MIIAIEGPDGAGKTTLLTELTVRRELRHFVVWHSGGPVANIADYFHRMNYVRGLQNLIVDRLPCLSEIVYCTAMGRPFPIPAVEMWHELLVINPILIYCTLSSSAEMLERMIAGKPHKPPDYYDKLRQNHPKICEKYSELMSEAMRAGLFVLRADWKIEGNTEAVIRGIVKEVTHREQREKLNARLKDRSQKPIDPTDIGLPHLDD
jgi:thymidylate kinase